MSAICTHPKVDKVDAGYAGYRCASCGAWGDGANGPWFGVDRPRPRRATPDPRCLDPQDVDGEYGGTELVPCGDCAACDPCECGCGQQHPCPRQQIADYDPADRDEH